MSREARVTRTVLLGAGASVEAGIPASREMVRMVHAASSRNPLRKAIEVAIGGLKFQRGATDQDPFGEPDIEEVYAALVALADRNRAFLAPFVGSWNDTLQNMDRPVLTNVRQPGDLQELWEKAIDAIANPKPSDSGDTSFSRILAEDRLLTALRATMGQRVTFFSAAQFVRAEVLKACWLKDPDAAAYISPLVSTCQSIPLRIATLNYDNSVELACSAKDVLYEYVLPGRATECTDGALSLAKLHGSVNWQRGDGGRVQVLDGPVRTDNRWPGPAMIFGAGTKLTVNGPYLDLLFTFRQWLQETDHLEVVGYSFRDAHVNHVIDTWFRFDDSKRMTVVDRSSSISSAAIARRLTDPEWWHNARGLPTDRVEVVHAAASEWWQKL